MTDAVIPTVYVDGKELKGGYMTQLPVVRRAENRPGSCRFTVVNDFTVPADNIMNASFGGWVSGTGALAVGSEVIVNDDVGMVFRGRVTTIDSTKPDLVTVECTDGIGLLAKVGNDLYRNYYGQYQSEKECWIGVDGNVPYIDLARSNIPSDAIIASGAAEWGMEREITYSSDDNNNAISFQKHEDWEPNSIYFWYEFRPQMDLIDKIDIPFRWVNSGVGAQPDFSMTAKIFVDGVLLKSVQKTIQESGWPSSESSITVDLNQIFVKNKLIRTHVEINFTNYRQYVGIFIQPSVPGTFQATRYLASGIDLINKPGWAPNLYIRGYQYETVAGTQSPGRYNTPSVNISETSPNFRNRARVSYTTGTAPVATVMDEIAKAIGMTFSDVSSKYKSLKEFRVGGGSVLDYFQLLADLRTSAGDNHSFDVNGTAIRLGRRKTVADAAVLRVLYGSENPSGNHAYLMSFRPTQTSKRKPNKVNVRGNIVYDDAGTKKTRPVVATVSDPGAKGVENCLTVFNNSLSSEADAYALAYSKLAEAKADSWEGTALLSGIHKVFNGDGSGEIVAIHHPLYSMNGYKTKVVEAVHDYNEQTTEIVLNSNSILYGNDVKDAGSMALITGNMSGDSAAQNLYYMQYVRVETTAAQSILSSGNKMTITYNKGTSTESLEVPVKSIVKHTKLGRQHVTATFEASLSKFSDKEHGVYQVKINNGAAISINEYRRPDFYKGQILIVDIMCPL